VRTAKGKKLTRIVSKLLIRMAMMSWLLLAVHVTEVI